MKKNQFLCMLLLCIFLYTTWIPSLATDQLNETDSVPAPPELTVDAAAALLLDADTGQVLYSQNPDEPLYPASTTKIMTAYLTLKYGDASAWFTVPEGISAGLNAYSSTAHLQVGEEVTIYELLQCLMIVSANEAANALAIYVSGSIEDFVALMNQEALALGCTETHFVNPNGLHDDDHYTTAHDLAQIAMAAMEYETFREICGTAEATMRETNLYQERNLTTTNYLLPGSSHPEYSYNGALGIKTGYTSQAGYCLVSEAYWEGRTLLAVVLGAKATDNGDTETIGSFTESAKLLSWGFYNYDTALKYQNYLEELAASEPEPSPTPEPTPSPSPSPTPEPTPSPSPSPTPEPTPSPSPSPTPELTPEPSPSPTPEPSPAPTAAIDGVETMLRAVARHFGISVKTLLFSVIGVAAALLVIVILILIRLLRSQLRKK